MIAKLDADEAEATRYAALPWAEKVVHKISQPNCRHSAAQSTEQ
jgi:hypothetical protein